jgi:hypothetical protein
MEACSWVRQEEGRYTEGVRYRLVLLQFVGKRPKTLTGSVVVIRCCLLGDLDYKLDPRIVAAFFERQGAKYERYTPAYCSGRDHPVRLIPPQ